MVDVTGHLAMGLLWALPAWFVWADRVALAFVGFSALMAPVPDVDVYIDRLFPELVHHHGVTHTVVFVVVLGVILGAIAAAVLTRPLDRWFEFEEFDARSMFAFAAGGLILGGLSHLFVDMLSAPDISTPIEPFWPFFDKPWSVDVLWYNSTWWNVGLLAVAVTLHVAVAYWRTPRKHPYRFTSR